MRTPVLLLAVLALTGCGATAARPAAGDRPPAVSAAPTLLADGTVPWVDEPAGPREFDLQPPPPPSARGARPCRADQLDAVLPRWYRQGDGGEPEARRPAPGLFGWVAVALRGGSPCTVQGRTSVRLLVDGVPAPVQYGNGVAAEAERTVTTLTPERGAELRVDWSPPFCGPAGRQELVVDLPEGRGAVRAPVREPATPACTGGGAEGDLGLRTRVSSGVFQPARRETPLDSPLGVLRATAERVPATAPAGGSIDYVVRLTNPTGRDVPLDPCPGYLQEAFVQSTGDAAGSGSSQLYRLNCRPVTSVPAGGSVAFRMRAAVPADPPGPSYSLAWRLVAPGLPGEDGLRFGVVLPVSR